MADDTLDARQVIHATLDIIRGLPDISLNLATDVMWCALVSAGALRDCDRDWATNKASHLHWCGHPTGHRGRCTCAVPRCHSWKAPT